MNNQFDPNNMSGWQQQQQNFQRMQQQFKMQNTTSTGTRFLLAFVLGFLPQLFLSIFGTSETANDPIKYGILWLIGIVLIIAGGLITALLVKFSKDIKSDVIIPVTAMSAAMLSFTVFLNVPGQLPPTGDGSGIGMFFVAMLMAFVFYIVVAIITWIIIFMTMMNKMKKQFMNGTNPFQNMMNPNMMNPNMNQNQQPKTPNKAWYKKGNKNSDQQPTINSEVEGGFGTHFEPQSAQDVKGKTKSSEDESINEKPADDKDKNQEEK